MPAPLIVSTRLAAPATAPIPIPIPIPVFHNCFRCGREFRGEKSKRVCPACSNPQPRKSPSFGKPLSLRERQVVDLVSKGKLNKEIAYELHLTEGTIKEYLNRVFHKVGCTNRTVLAVAFTTGRIK